VLAQRKNNVVSLAHLIHQFGYFLGRALKIPIDLHDPLLLRIFETGAKRGLQAEISRKGKIS